MLEKRKLTPLLILPMALLLVVPFVTQAQSGNTYFLAVSCDNYSTTEVDTSTITFLGHTVTVTCSAVDGFNENTVSFASSALGVFAATANAEGIVHTGKGLFGPNGCFIEGQSYSSAFRSYAFWEIYTSWC
jgi:hypothetical protein